MNSRIEKTFTRAAAACAAVAIVAVAGLAAPRAQAAPCAGFTDVQDTDNFCPNVEWLKNRAITLGCTSATLYCPGDPVNRLAMAAFMNRLGNALTPVELEADEIPQAIDVDAGRVICQSQDLAAATYPRRAYVDTTLSSFAPATVSYAVDLVVSTDGGATWSNLNATGNRGVSLANRWSNLSDLGFRDIDVGQTARFGARVTRGGLAGATDLTDSRCQLRALVHNRNGTTSPY